MDRKYYLIKEGHKLEQKVDDFINEMHSIRKKWNEFCRKYDGAETWHRGHYLDGLSFDGDPPDGWHRPKGSPDGCYKPRSNRKVSKDAYKDFKAIPRQLSGMDFCAAIGFDYTSSAAPGGGMMMHYASFEKFGDTLVISLPENGEPPNGLVPLKNSEYWAMQESAA